METAIELKDFVLLNRKIRNAILDASIKSLLFFCE